MRGRGWLRLTCALALALACWHALATPAAAAAAAAVAGRGVNDAACDAKDGAALRELYHVTGGPAWRVGWDVTSDCCCGWHGVGCDGGGRVMRLCVRARPCVRFSH